MERIAYHLASGLSAAGFSVSWAAFSESEQGAGAVKRIALRGWNQVESRWGLPMPVIHPSQWLKLYHAVKESDAVLVHDCLYLHCLLANVIAHQLHKTVVVVQHIGRIPYSAKMLRLAHTAANRLIAVPLLARAQGAVFYSLNTQKCFADSVRFRSPPRFLPNGVDLELFSPGDRGVERRAFCRRHNLEEEKLLVLFAGRFVARKGTALIRQAAALLPGCRFLFVGAGPDDPRRWGCSNVLVFPAVEQQELVHFYRAADVLLLPAAGEGFPLVVQEAMACGLPCIVSQEIAQLESGWAKLVKAVDPESDAIVSALDEFARAGKYSGQQSTALRCYAQERWNWAKTIDAYAELLRTCRNPGD